MRKKMDNLSDAERLIMGVATVIILVGAFFMNIPTIVIGFVLFFAAKPISNHIGGSKGGNKKS
ncbi:hypothetical protein [Xylocopilactobacillus apis]|uniref:Uncharacterized protein n=1 Tax=Xylocopilactobacillus apis TaxID=2932183 RepID=A0AAU9D9Y5_9LACO|nr:hypothetical protein [Xylocopilactobacillus apis]BDR56460.1 hypothetical protein KIMC2_10220 [Xylocopilactobacillus apis]